MLIAKVNKTKNEKNMIAVLDDPKAKEIFRLPWPKFGSAYKDGRAQPSLSLPPCTCIFRLRAGLFEIWFWEACIYEYWKPHEVPSKKLWKLQSAPQLAASLNESTFLVRFLMLKLQMRTRLEVSKCKTIFVKIFITKWLLPSSSWPAKRYLMN